MIEHTYTHASRGAFTLMFTSNHTIALYSFIVLLYHHSFRVAWCCLWNRWKLQWWCQWIHNPHEGYSRKYLPPGTYYCMRCEMFTFYFIILPSVVFHFLLISVKWETHNWILRYLNSNPSFDSTSRLALGKLFSFHLSLIIILILGILWDKVMCTRYLNRTGDTHYELRDFPKWSSGKESAC